MNCAEENAVMILPWYIIRKIQINLAKKVGLAAIFSVGLITIACDILRTIKSFSEALFSDSSLYTFLEVTLAVIVSCLPIYRALLRDKPKEKANKGIGDAFTPMDETSKRRMLTSSRPAAHDSNMEGKGGLAKYAQRLSTDFFQRQRRDKRLESEEQHLASHTLQGLPSIQLGSISWKSVDVSSLV